MMRQVNSNDAGAMDALGTCYYNGVLGLQQDQSKALDLWIRAAELGFRKSHNNLWVCIITTMKQRQLNNGYCQESVR